MTQRVVYVLGAGFSAPLGLPVIRNFIEKSKDLFFQDPVKFQAFEKVFDHIRTMSVVKNYYVSDMFDIEEVLSILDLRAFAGELTFKDMFVDYIRTVINETTPKFSLGFRSPNDDGRNLFENDLWSAYAYFVLELFNVRPAFQFNPPDTTTIPKAIRISETPGTVYDIVTLNYDVVLESLAALFMYEGRPLKFQLSDDGSLEYTPTLAKLHGSVNGEIVPPTWRKGDHSGVGEAWGSAIKLLRRANYIRYIGYSLPPTDSYIRYLLKAAAIDAPNLKGIDIISLDSFGILEKRYREFL